MAQAVVELRSGAELIMEQVVIKGDLSKLEASERAKYYMAVCNSIGLNPLTRPFEYITLNGKLVLYATKSCTDQLRAIHGVSVEDLSETERGDVFIVTAKVRNKEGRTDMAKGAVTVGSLKGDALANALMKAETKAKRRATLSVCGLGMLDESEIETIPAANPQATPLRQVASSPLAPQPAAPPHDPETGEVKPHLIAVPLAADGQRSDWIAWGRSLIAAIKSAKTIDEGNEWVYANNAALDNCADKAPKAHKSIIAAIEDMRARLRPAVEIVTNGEDAEIVP